MLQNFLWKVIRHALPVDVRLQSCGVYLVSRCRCCVAGHVETLRHLFIESDISLATWKCFGSIFQLPHTYGSVLQALSIWFEGAVQNTQYGNARVAMAAYVLREIWVERCRSPFYNSKMSARAICLRIFYKVHTLDLLHLPKLKGSQAQNEVLNVLGITPMKVARRRGKWLRWDKPYPGWFKLNVDSLTRDDKITGGGVIRDSDGNVIRAFSRYYGDGTNNVAEFLALRDGLRMCIELRLVNVIIECDSTMVVDSISTGKCSSWAHIYVFHECLDCVKDGYNTVHGLRQKNIVADRLADYAYSHRAEIEFDRNQDLPRTIARAVVADKIGLWNYRV